MTSAQPSILVADDDPDIRDLVVFKLEQAGFAVRAVADGSAALTALDVAGHEVLATGASVR
ncbi:hypothetical protein [Kocuria marina]|uniref:hypothetical protein n=1 Tax=Kocuria marina TaxID=223184 RepID=UPI0022E6070D|nr:hypothetical protein [Kocuria marina]